MKILYIIHILIELPGYDNHIQQGLLALGLSLASRRECAISQILGLEDKCPQLVESVAWCNVSQAVQTIDFYFEKNALELISSSFLVGG